jgi:hypothetical protein
MKTSLKSVFTVGCTCFCLNSVAQAAPKVIFTLPKGNNSKSLDISAHILCTEAPGTTGAARSATFFLNDAGAGALEKFTKPLIGKHLEYSICGGKKQRVKVTEVLSSNMLTLGILPNAPVSCLNIKQSCE